MEIKLSDLYSEGNLTLIYGPAASGKTSLAFKIAYIESARGNTVAYVSTENELFLDRPLKGRYLKKILIVAVRVFAKQHFIITRLIDNLVEHYSLKLLIVDSITGLMRVEEDFAKASSMLKFELASLLKVSRKHRIPVILTSQVRAILESEGESYEAAAKTILEYWCGNIIRLNIVNKGLREGIVERSMKSENEGKRFLFEIVGEGIVKLRDLT